MAELESIQIFNPSDEDFTQNFNGEAYTVPAKGAKSYPVFLAYHIAKHLSDKLLLPELIKIKEEHSKAKNVNPFNPKTAQLMVYDNPKRRIALYECLKSKQHVQTLIEKYPFKAFIGEMNQYDDFVMNQRKPTVEKERGVVDSDTPGVLDYGEVAPRRLKK